jgi:hypothetical protein
MKILTGRLSVALELRASEFSMVQAGVMYRSSNAIARTSLWTFNGIEIPIGEKW